MIIHAVTSPRTAAELARISGMPLNLTCYHLRQLCALGLMVPAGRKERAGRPTPLYRTAGDAFFVPAELADRSWGDERSRDMRALLERSQRDLAGELFSVESDRIEVRKIHDEERGAPRSMELWLMLKLDEVAACELRQELQALTDRYESRALESGKGFVFHVALAPMGD